MAATLGDWTTFNPREWVICQGHPSAWRRRNFHDQDRYCGRSLFRLGPDDGPVEARYAGNRQEPPAEDMPYQLHYCRDCKSFTAVRRPAAEARAS